MTTATNPPSTPRNLRRGWTIALFGIILFSIGPSATKIALTDGFIPVNFLLMRYLIGTTLMVITIAIIGPHYFRVDRRGLLLCISAGALLVTALQIFTLALTRINASIASMLVALYPLIALVLLALRGEKFTYRNGFRIILSLIGVYLLIGPEGKVDLVGAALVITASIIFAFYMVMIQWYLTDYETRTVALYVVITILFFNTGLWLWQGAVWPVAGWSGWAAVIFMGVGTSYLGQLALYSAVREIGSGQMALLNPLESLPSVIWATALLREQLSLIQWIGGTLILISMLLAIQRIRRSPRLTWRARLRLRL
ncbi:MAG: DMT family transporter [Chloroflexota bacterium]